MQWRRAIAGVFDKVQCREDLPGIRFGLPRDDNFRHSLFEFESADDLLQLGGLLPFGFEIGLEHAQRTVLGIIKKDSTAPGDQPEKQKEGDIQSTKHAVVAGKCPLKRYRPIPPAGK